jgi:hypothetical protein
MTTPADHTTSVGPHNGAPTLFRGNEPTFAALMSGIGPTAGGLRSGAAARHFAEAGIHLYAFDVGTAGTLEWRGPAPGRVSHFCFSEVESRFGQLLDVDPEAHFLLRVHLEMQRYRPWWLERYPEECEVTSRGLRPTQSFASTVWRQQANDFLRAYIEHFSDIGLVDRVIGYKTGAGHTSEWVKGLTSMSAPCGDYSQPMRRHFRSWLRSRYGNDVCALREAWADRDLCFETAEVPSEADQLGTTHQSFRDPRREQNAIDYYRCLADLCADLIIGFNRTVKEATDGRALAGAFYGYLMELAWNAGFFNEGPDSPYSTIQRSGHLGLGKVLCSPYTDFLVSPYSYGFRGVGGLGASMLPTDSLRVHGKLYIMEEDTCTHLTAPGQGFARARSLEESITLLKRNFLEVLTRGQGVWWSGGQHNLDPDREPAFQPLLQRFQKVGTFALNLDRRTSAEIAVLLDDESYFYESVRNDLDLPLIFQQRLWGLPRLGAPAETYLLDDFLEGRLKPYKLYILLNAFRLDAERRAALARELRRDGRVALWVYAPGYIEDEPGLEHMTDLTGFRFGKGAHAWGPLVHILDFQHPITQGLRQDLFWGTNSRLGPVFHLEDLEAKVLGQVVYSQGRCKPGFGVKEFADWKSVYVAAPNIPAPVLRGVARYAGVHLYSEAGDVLYATPQLLGVHTVGGGERTFKLPGKVEAVYDLFEQTMVARDVEQFSVTLPMASTALYYVGEADLLATLEG